MEVVTVESFLTLLANAIDFATSLAKTFLAGMPLNWVFLGVGDKTELMSKILYDEVNIFRQEFDNFDDSEAYKNATLSLISEYSKMREKTPMIEARLMKLHSIMNAYDNQVRSVKRQRAAFAVLIHGVPGTGKSTIGLSVMRELSDVLGYTWRGDSSVAVQNFASQFDDTYRNNPCMLAEDMATLKSTNPQAGMALSKILNIINTVPVPALCASVENKGNIFYRVKCFVGTTNTPHLDAIALVNNPQAVYRRFIFVRAYPRPELKGDGGGFDKIKVAKFSAEFRRIHPDASWEYFTALYDIKIHTYDENKTQLKLQEYDGNEINEPNARFIGLTYQELIHALRKIAAVRAGSQDHELSRIDDFKQCSCCKLLERTCPNRRERDVSRILGEFRGDDSVEESKSNVSQVSNPEDEEKDQDKNLDNIVEIETISSKDSSADTVDDLEYNTVNSDSEALYSSDEGDENDSTSSYYPIGRKTLLDIMESDCLRSSDAYSLISDVTMQSSFKSNNWLDNWLDWLYDNTSWSSFFSPQEEDLEKSEESHFESFGWELLENPLNVFFRLLVYTPCKLTRSLIDREFVTWPMRKFKAIKDSIFYFVQANKSVDIEDIDRNEYWHIMLKSLQTTDFLPFSTYKSTFTYILSLCCTFAISPLLFGFYLIETIFFAAIYDRIKRTFINRIKGKLPPFGRMILNHGQEVLERIVQIVALSSCGYLIYKTISNKYREHKTKERASECVSDSQAIIDEKPKDLVERKLWNTSTDPIVTTSKGVTSTSEQFFMNHKLHRIVLSFDKNKVMRGYTIFVGSKLLVMPYHFVSQPGYTLEGMTIYFKSNRGDQVISVKDSRYWTIKKVGSDLCLVTLHKCAPQASILDFFSEETINYRTGQVNLFLVTLNSEDTMSLYNAEYIGHDECTVVGMYENAKLPLFRVTKTIVKGDCGSLLIDANSNTIIGMLHAKRISNSNIAVIEDINKTKLKNSLISQPIICNKNNVISTSYAEIVDKVHARSFRNFIGPDYRPLDEAITEPACFSYGELGEDPVMSTFIPDVKKTLQHEVIYDRNEARLLDLNFIPEDYGAPRFSKDFPRWKPLSDVGYNLSVPLPEVNDSCLDEIVQFKREQFSKYGRGITPLNMKEFNRGRQSQGFNDIKSIDFKTSMGYPFNSSKKNYSHREGEERFFNQEVIDYLEEYKQTILKGFPISPIFTASHKNEVVRIAKNKVRIFYGCDIHFLYLARCYLLPIFNCITNDPLIGTSYVGCNYNGYDWEKLYHIFKDKDVIDADYKSFDQKVPIWVKRAIFEMLDVIVENSAYTDEDKVLYNFAKECLMNPLVNVNGELIAFENLMPSGVPITVLFNCLISYLYVELGYRKTHEDSKCGDLTIITYGDDNLVGKDERLEVDINLIQEYLKSIGITYTPSDKTEKFHGWKKIIHCSFLKRGFLPLADGRVLAPLEVASILKPLFYTVSRDLVAQASSVFINVIREAGHQPEEISKLLIDIVKSTPFLEISNARLELKEFIDHVYPLGWDCRKKILMNIYPRYAHSQKKEERTDAKLVDFEELFLDYGSGDDSNLTDRDQELLELYKSNKQDIPEIRGSTAKYTAVGSTDKLRDYSEDSLCLSELPSITRCYITGVDSDIDNDALTLGHVWAYVNRPTIVNIVNNKNNKYEYEPVSMMGAATIHDEDSNQVVNMTGNISLNQNDRTETNLSNIMSRPFTIVEWNWTSAAEFSKNFDCSARIFNEAFYERKYDNYAFISGNLRLKFLVNGSPFFFGKLIVASYYNRYGPSDGVFYDNFTDLTQNDTDIMRKMRISMSPHVVIDPSSSESPEIVMPLMTPYSKISLHNFLNQINLRIAGGQLNPLSTVSDDVTVSTNITVIGNLEDVVLSGPTTDLVSVSQLEDDCEIESEKKANKPSDYISKAADIVDSVGIYNPSILDYTTPTSFVMRLGARLAKYFGYARPVNTEPQHVYKPEFFNGIANVDTVENLQKLTLYKSQNINMSQQKNAFSEFNTEGDPLIINNFCNRECYYSTTQWDGAQSVGSIVMCIGVTPSIFNFESGVDQDLIQYSHMGLISQMFKYWRGKITYRFEVVCSQFHRGRLRICWDPRQSLSTGTSLTACKNVILDLGKTREAEITVDWGVQDNYLLCDHYYGTSPTFNTHVGATILTPEYSLYNGLLTVNVMNDLSLPNGTVSSVGLNVYVKSDDIEFAFPTNVPLQRGSLYTSVSELQSIDEDSVSVEEDMLGPRSLVSDITFGERCYTLRSLLKRYELNEIYTPDDTAATKMILNRPVYPPSRGADSNPLITDHNYTKLSLFSIVASCFMGVRGGTRIKIIPTATPTSNPWVSNDMRSLTFSTGDVSSPGYSPVYYDDEFTTSELVTAQKNYLRLYDTMEATAISHGRVNPILEVEVPYYNKFAYLPGRNYRNTLSRNFVQYRGPTDSLNIYYATAEDTQFFGLMAVPLMYCYALPTAI